MWACTRTSACIASLRTVSVVVRVCGYVRTYVLIMLCHKYSSYVRTRWYCTVHVYVPWYHGTHVRTMVHVYQWYCNTIWYTFTTLLSYYLKNEENDLKYKHSGATGTLVGVVSIEDITVY